MAARESTPGGVFSRPEPLLRQRPEPDGGRPDLNAVFENAARSARGGRSVGKRWTSSTLTGFEAVRPASSSAKIVGSARRAYTP